MPSLLTAALLLNLPLPALAFDRPQAVSLSGEWQLAAAEPLSELVDEASLPTAPLLIQRVEDLIPADCIANPYGFVPDPAEFKAVKLPLAWEHSLGTDYDGAGWYRRELAVPREWLADGRSVWLEFDSVSCAGGVWVAGQWCGGHVGDNIRWRVELTAALRIDAILDSAEDAGPETAELLVYVEEVPGHISAGFGDLLDPQHGGIWRDLRIYDSSHEPVPVANRVTSILVPEEERQRLDPLLGDWYSLRYAAAAELSSESLSPTWQSLVLISTQLSPEVVEYANRGGAAIVLMAAGSGEPGAGELTGEHRYIHCPQRGPLQHSLQIDHYWLQEHWSGMLFGAGAKSIPVTQLGIEDAVDPLLRTYEMNSDGTPTARDHLFAARIGSGMLMVSSLDHSTDAGQILLGELASYCDRWIYEGKKRSLSPLWEYPSSKMSLEMALRIAE